MRSIRHIYRFIKIFKKLTFSPTVILPSLEWDEGDAKNLEAFFKSETGERLRKFMNNLEAENNARAVIENKNTQYNAGTAFGGRSMVAHIFSLSVTDPQPQSEGEYDTYRNEAELDEVEKLLSRLN